MDIASKLKVELRDRIGVVTLSDPATLNAASEALTAELHTRVEALMRDEAARAIVITAEGRGFSSGANLADDGLNMLGKPGPHQGLMKIYNPFLSLLRRSPKPLVAAVNGIAAGIGVSIALSCDLVVAAESASFILAFRRVGLTPDGGATWMLPRLIGKARAMELLLLGEKLPAATALEWGMINRCVPDAELMDAAMALAGTLAEGPSSLGLTRQLVWEGLDAAWHAHLETEAYVQGEAVRTADAREGVTAFLDKRKATFDGR